MLHLVFSGNLMNAWNRFRRRWMAAGFLSCHFVKGISSLNGSWTKRQKVNDYVKKERSYMDMALGPKWYCFHSRACIYAWCVEVVRILTVEFRPTLKNTSMSHRYRLKQCFTSAGEGDLSKGFKVLSPGKEMMIKMTKTGNKNINLAVAFQFEQRNQRSILVYFTKTSWKTQHLILSCPNPALVSAKVGSPFLRKSWPT